MKTLKNIRISQKSLLTHRLRTMLALLGIIVGVSAVIIMVAIGNGARQEIVSKIEAMGTNLIIVNSGELRASPGRRNIRGRATTLTLEDSKRAERLFSSIIAAVPAQSGKMQVKFGNYSTNTAIVGTSPEFPEVRDFKIDTGWFFSERENRLSERVAVLGKGVAENLFGGQDPLGAVIRIGKVPFKVIGVLRPKGVDMHGDDQDDQILVPINAALRRLFNQDYIESIYFQVDHKENMDTVMEQVKELLRQRHGLAAAGNPDDFTIQSQTDLIEARKETSNTFTTLTASIAGISLIVGGIGILAVMLLSIRERRPEIGLRMAVGAKRADVRKQFIFESVFLSVGGGLIGIIAGVSASLTLELILAWSMAVSSFSIVLSFVFSLLIGVFFGVYPAHRASLLDPIEALRSE